MGSTIKFLISFNFYNWLNGERSSKTTSASCGQGKGVYMYLHLHLQKNTMRTASKGHNLATKCPAPLFTHNLCNHGNKTTHEPSFGNHYYAALTNMIIIATSAGQTNAYMCV